MTDDAAAAKTSSVLHLQGIAPYHPVGALAALGICTWLATLPRKTTVAFTRADREGENPWMDRHLVIRKVPARLADAGKMAAALHADMLWWASTPVLAGAPDELRLDRSTAAHWITRVADTGDERIAAQLRGMIDTDPLRKGHGINDITRTRLDFTSGQIKFLSVVRHLADTITVDDLAATLTGDGVREIAGYPTLRWSGTPTAPAAYRATPPASERPTRPVGIEWLAWLGLAALPVREVPLTDRLHWIAWPEVSPAEAIDAAAQTASYGGVFAGDIFSAGIRWAGYYGEFAPASMSHRTPMRADASVDLSAGHRINYGAPERFVGPDTPVGAKEIAWLLGVEPKTVDQWSYRGLLPERDFVVGGRPAWTAGTIGIWCLETGRRFGPLYGQDEATLPVARWLIKWALETQDDGDANPPGFDTGLLAGQYIHSKLRAQFSDRAS